MSKFQGFLGLKKPDAIDGIGIVRTKILDLWSFEEDGEILTLHIQDKKSAKVIKAEIKVEDVKFFDVINDFKTYEVIAAEEKPSKRNQNDIEPIAEN